ncbi:hypothetical protein HY249_01490, partial [Candidatus Azambacteria bacterium]|nr:hypothetical protein [Candidatus Azambacteria bacterium]
MQVSDKTQKLLEEIGLKYIETIVERRGTLALRVSCNGKRAVLKLQSEDGSKEASYKARLLVGEAEILSKIPHLTNQLYMDHGNNNGRQWLLVREINGEEVNQAAKRIRESTASIKERTPYLLKL